ncbi:predicted protein [Naegleria gruberi]|uniref:Predicted protein n=1 Tax=Naegleria gruberi TaxID=5762 RepID=D2V6D6_NAEGR|nr:uncharacterized protein NAEGRDRAFT_47037 [Naegleria gruberi]EFC47429.1 predicted protein [Naegleria gruberi]|eukprot:XP_002680173.1 predicted protein [Naegleria gruberi strain NEG-M]
MSGSAGKDFSHSLQIHLKQALFYSLYGRVSELEGGNYENKKRGNSMEKIGKRLLKEYETIIEWMENDGRENSSSLNECKCLFMDWNLLKRRFNYLKFKFYASFVERTRKLDSMMKWFAKFTRMIVFPIRMLRRLIFSSMKIHINSELKSLIIVPREKLSWIVLFSDRVLSSHSSIAQLFTCWKHVKAEIERVKKLRYGTIVERLQLYLVFRKLSLRLEQQSRHHSSHTRFLLDFGLKGLEKFEHDVHHLKKQPLSPSIDSFVHLAKVYNPIENEEYSGILTFEMLDNLLGHVGVKSTFMEKSEDITMIFSRILDSMEVISNKCIRNLLSKVKVNGKIERNQHVSKSHLYKSFNVWKSMFSKTDNSKIYPYWEEIEEFMDTFIHMKGSTIISFFMYLFNVKTLIEFITCKLRGTFVNVNINQSVESTLHQASDMLMNLESGLNEEYSVFSFSYLRQSIGEICNFEELLEEIDSNRKKHALQNFIIVSALSY